MTTEEIKKTFLEPRFQRIIQEPVFYFQKGKDALQKWLDLEVPKQLEEELIRLSSDYTQFLEIAEINPEVEKVKDLLLEIIAYCDTHAKDKLKYNRYEDNRILAKASVRMPNWIDGLMKQKFGHGQINGQSIINALEYLLNPQENCTILSDNHRKMVSENLLKKVYNRDSFILEFKDHFHESVRDLENENNYTHLISRLVYEFENEWKEEVIGLMASDGTGWQEEATKLEAEYEGLIIWNSKKPNGGKKTLDLLRGKINDEQNFPLYYTSHGHIQYKATVVDFVINQKELSNKKWESRNIKHLYSNFADYKDKDKDGKKKAYILFLAESIEKITPKPISDFKFYGSFSQPRQDNLSPIKEVLNDELVIKPELTMTDDTPNIPLNQILYGPPGTGKTYNTILRSVEIVSPSFNIKKPFKDVKDKFDDLVKAGQIVFTTFHQSMSYEDFVEGIKPQEPKKDGDPVIYKVEPGVFKSISEEAKRNLGLAVIAANSETSLPFEIAFQQLEAKVEEANLEEPDLTPNGMTKGLVIKLPNSFFSISNISGSSIRMMNRSGNEQNTMTKSTLKKIYEAPGKADSIIKGGMIGYYKALTSLMLSWNKEIRNEAKGLEEKKFVLIIDEINRGNISAIFGELITLIEKSKRYGSTENECIEVTLPYSKDFFSVPANLYIIGTMNTADRSVEALDTALRRRFSFTEMPPIPNLVSPKGMILRLWNKEEYFNVNWDHTEFRKKADALNELLGIDSSFEEQFHSDEDTNDGKPLREWTLEDLKEISDDQFEGVNLKKILSTINRRIGILLDKDHYIGHSFFMKVGSLQELKVAFSKEIIPLLQEYFFGDYGKISLVLGEGFCKGIKVNDQPSEDVFAKTTTDYDASVFLDKIIYSLNDPLEMQSDEIFIDAIDQLLNS